MTIEYWVMRVLLHPGTWRPLKRSDMHTTEEKTTLALQVDRGALALLPDGCIAEPVEIFKREEDAHEHRRKLLHDNPRSDYRVILNSDVTV